MQSTRSTPLALSLFPAHTRNVEVARALIFTFVGVCLLTLSAKAQVPFYPVPLTLQSLVLLMIGAAYGAPLAFVTGIAYLGAGAMGFPVFAGTPEKGLGLAYMAGPTAGYLVAFPVAMWIAGKTAEKPGIFRLLAGFLLAHVVIFMGGFAWLNQLMGAEKAMAVGVMPFILATVVKTALAAAAYFGLIKIVQK